MFLKNLKPLSFDHTQPKNQRILPTSRPKAKILNKLELLEN